ncbi:BglG family transcription antiterminator [Bacillus sp. PS06]|uniref:BglG family transcription antiterminator n=1 Tax=Bacillus sp. PS06 TaxID=2764176 RepID=UPI0017849BD6|nr:PRD domain-containing protein [Bacillus sp. PS06]MBD8070812.1 BglG family transcription antiterminator [Bacillus sp. PS06]
MYISARERKILELLLARNEETTVKDLANELQVSSRTVHRDLKGVEEILKEYDLGLNKKSGIGIQMIGDDETKEKLKLFLFNLSHSEYTPEERQTIILSELLDSTEPVKLMSLANDLNVTIATISNDLNKVEERLAAFQLHLLRKRGYGVEITGSESAKRKAMSKHIIENIDEYELISMIKETIQKKSSQAIDTITDRLLGLVDKKKLLIIERQIDQIKDDLPYSIADSAYIGLVVHLALALERIQQGEDINFDSDYLQSLKDTKEYKVAEKIVVGLEDIFRINISHGEIGYITMHLMGAKHRNDHEDLLEDTSLHVGMLAQKLIRFVSDEIETDLTKNISLFQGLVAHLRPALYRLKQNMGISNPLLTRIEQDYHDIFSVLEKGVQEIFPDLHVPKEEIGYLVMHFASALLNKDQHQELKTLVVCSSGIGTSKILSTKLQQQIAGLQTVNASLFDLDDIDINEFDAIISTIPLKDFTEDYLVVSPLLSADEVDKVKRFLLGKNKPIRKSNQQETMAKLPGKTGDFLQHIRKMKNVSTAIYQILNGFSFTRIEESQSVESILTSSCEELLANGIISGDAREVLSDLLQREEIGGLGIPGTSLALYHTKSRKVLEPSFTITRLKNPIEVKAMDGSQVDMNTVLLMLSPVENQEETLEILSAISSLIIRDEQSIKQFESGEEQEIVNLLTTELKSIYEQTLTH